MSKGDNILTWVNCDMEEKYQNQLDSFCKRLNVYSTRIYIDEKNVQLSNNTKQVTDNPTRHKRSTNKPIIDNKINKLSPIFMLFISEQYNVKYSKKTASAINLSKSLNIPILLINKDLLDKNPERIITSVDYHKKSRERTAWANYWAKKTETTIELIYPKEEDDYIIEDINANIYFSEKLFSQSRNTYILDNTANISEKNLDTLIKKTEEKTNCLLIISTSNLSLFPRIFKPKEIKLLNKCGKNPVFLIPPNHDYTIPCH